MLFVHSLKTSFESFWLQTSINVILIFFSFLKTRKYLNVVHSDVHGMHTDKYLYLDNYIHCLALQRMANDGKCNGYYSMVRHPSFPFVSFQLVCL